MKTTVKKPPKQRACGCGKDITHLPGGTAYCSACCNARGICTGCKARSQDVPGYKTCSRCQKLNREINKREGDRMFARIGTRGIIPEWKVREIERSKALGAKLLAECLAAKEQQQNG